MIKKFLNKRNAYAFEEGTTIEDFDRFIKDVYGYKGAKCIILNENTKKKYLTVDVSSEETEEKKDTPKFIRFLGVTINNNIPDRYFYINKMN